MIGKGENRPTLVILPNTRKLIHILLGQEEEPHSYWTHYIPNKGTGPKGFVVICPGIEICPACKSKLYKTSRKHAMNVWDFDANTTKILEAGNSIGGQLRLIKDSYGTLDNVDISIQRTGSSGIDTQYVVIPIPRQEPFKEKVVLFNIPEIKTVTPPEEIKKYMDGVNKSDGTDFNPQKLEASSVGQVLGKNDTAPEPSALASAPADTAPSLPAATTTDSASTPGISAPFVMPFGKYKGQSLEQIAKIDIDYVDWCAKNMSNQEIKAEAQKIYEIYSNKPESTDPQLDTSALVSLIQDTINQKPEYKGNYTTVVTKMKEASKSATHPNGKTLLQEFTLEELNLLLHSL